MTLLAKDVLHRLETEANIWLATVRPDGRPHLTPVWFAWYQEKLYACIQARSVKCRNLRQNSRVSLSLENGSNVVICEGTARFVTEPWPATIASIFRQKYEWNILTDSEYDRLLEITPARWLTW